MSEHHPADDNLVAYALDEVGAAEREEIASHLAECKPCAAVVRRLGSIIETYRTSTDAGAPPGILAELMEAQSAARERMATPWWRLKPVYAAAAAAGIAVLFLSGFLAGRISAPTPAVPGAHPETQIAIPRPLPDPPVIDFQTEPPLARFASAGEGGQLRRAVHEGSDSRRDSL
jgi:anti-sigma factor RsiW